MAQTIELRASHATLLAEMLKGRTLLDAAAAAGITESVACRAMQSPRFQHAMREAISAKLISEGAPTAYVFLQKVVAGTDSVPADTRTKVAAAKILLQAAGFVAPKPADAPNSQAPEPAAMTTDELRKFVAAGERELSERAQPIEDPAEGIFG